jgi:SAM-dependent methyltransferase
MDHLATHTELSTPLPDEEMIFLVNGHRDKGEFAISRVAVIDNIIALLDEAGIDYQRFKSILDFGCGCGRALAGWEWKLPPQAQLFGIDINQTLIDFCKRNIPFAQSALSRYLPPIEFQDASIDFLYAASVFTHMKLHAAMAWAGELARVVEPNAIMMMSYHGAYFAPQVAQLSKEGSRQLEEHGFYCHLHVRSDTTWEGSNHYATFMTSAFVNSLFKGFDLVRIYPGLSRGPNPFASYQDIAIFRRTNEM